MYNEIKKVYKKLNEPKEDICIIRAKLNVY